MLVLMYHSGIQTLPKVVLCYDKGHFLKRLERPDLFWYVLSDFAIQVLISYLKDALGYDADLFWDTNGDVCTPCAPRAALTSSEGVQYVVRYKQCN
jgi:hypothetical protein